MDVENRTINPRQNPNLRSKRPKARNKESKRAREQERANKNKRAHPECPAGLGGDGRRVPMGKVRSWGGEAVSDGPPERLWRLLGSRRRSLLPSGRRPVEPRARRAPRWAVAERPLRLIRRHSIPHFSLLSLPEITPSRPLLYSSLSRSFILPLSSFFFLIESLSLFCLLRSLHVWTRHFSLHILALFSQSKKSDLENEREREKKDRGIWERDSLEFWEREKSSFRILVSICPWSVARGHPQRNPTSGMPRVSRLLRCCFQVGNVGGIRSWVYFERIIAGNAPWDRPAGLLFKLINPHNTGFPGVQIPARLSVSKFQIEDDQRNVKEYTLKRSVYLSLPFLFSCLEVLYVQ